MNQNELLNMAIKEFPEMKDELVKSGHPLVLRDNRILWKKTIVKEEDLNKVAERFHREGINKNDEPYRNYYRSIGYSLFGYWEIFYWDVNNKHASLYSYTESIKKGKKMLSQSKIVGGYLNLELIDQHMILEDDVLKHLASPIINIRDGYPNYGKVTCGHTGWDLNLFTGQYDIDGFPIFVNHIVLDDGGLAYIDWIEEGNVITFCLSNYHCGCCPITNVKIVGIENPNDDEETFLYLKDKEV